MAKEFIVAIGLGSSKITGIAGKKNTDGSISVLAVVREDSSSCIRKGVVYNIDKTAQCLTNIISRLRTSLGTEISQVYVGLGGQSVRGIKNVIGKNLPPETIVTQAMVNELMDANRAMTYPDAKILDAIIQEFRVDTQLQLDPVGIQASRLEANFLNILCRRSFYNSLKRCFDMAGIAIADTFLSAVTLADSVLTENERRSGCLLVDLGAETTTVALYYRDILRHLSVIPLGSNNITKDIESLQIDENEAERMKLKFASAYTDSADIDKSLHLRVNDDRSIDSTLFIEIVEARLEEIIENVWFQVPTEYTDKILGGIVLTGGGSNMPNIETAFRRKTHIDKVRVAKFVSFNVTVANSKVTLPRDATMNTVLSLVAAGNMNCAGGDVNNTLFNPEGEPTQSQRAPGSMMQSGRTVQKNSADEDEERRRKEDEERKRKEEEAELKRIEEEEAELKRKEEERKRNSWFNKTMRKTKDFFHKMVEPEN